MSYNLYFRPRQGDLSFDEVSDYFLARPYYKLEKRQFWYENPKTGVYFYFLFEPQNPDDTAKEEFYPIEFNINFYRPSFFIVEAAPEVSAFIGRFDLAISCPQIGGMGQGPYAEKSLIDGWNEGNEFAYSGILKNEPQTLSATITLPAQRLHEIWHWNKRVDERQALIGQDIFVPQIGLLSIGQQTVVAAVWTDGIPILIPPVDCFLVLRKQLANRRFFRKAQDWTLLELSKAHFIFQRHAISRHDQTQLLNYKTPPADVVSLIKSLPRIDRSSFSFMAKDSVLDRELVAKYSSS